MLDALKMARAALKHVENVGGMRHRPTQNAIDDAIAKAEVSQ